MTKNISGPEIYSYIYSLAETQDCINNINSLLINYDSEKNRKQYEELIYNEVNGDKILSGIYNIMNSLTLLSEDITIKLNIPEPPIKINELNDNDILAKFIHK